MGDILILSAWQREFCEGICEEVLSFPKLQIKKPVIITGFFVGLYECE